MSFRDPAIELAKEKEQRQQDALKQGWESVGPYLRKAYLRLQLTNPIIMGRLLKNYAGEEIFEHFLSLLDPPSSPAEAKIQFLADIVIALVYSATERKIETIISKASREIEKAYTVISQKGGGPGWSPDPAKVDKRKMAVLDWFRGNQTRLSYLKEAHLQDTDLYNPGSGQEKRNFIARLIIKIMEEETGKNLTFQKVKSQLENLKKLQQPLRFEDL